jgi:hypothetical protein
MRSLNLNPTEAELQDMVKFMRLLIFAARSLFGDTDYSITRSTKLTAMATETLISVNF